MAEPLKFLPLSPDLVGSFETLFGPSGACYGCWCTYFLLRPKIRASLSPDERREVMFDSIRSGPPPGLLAFSGNNVIGWMRIGPRAAIPEWNNPGRSSSPLPDAPASDMSVWAVSCFFFKSRERGQGLSHPFLQAGIAYARAQGARLLEASPMDRAKQSKSIGLYVGSTSVFQKAGFTEVARAKPGRPLMRLML